MPLNQIFKGIYFHYQSNYNFGPAEINAFPAGVSVYFSKFLMYRAERSFAFFSHSDFSE